MSTYTGQSVFKKVKTDEDKYAQILNELINNRNLSYKALGIITYILSKPCDWQVYISDLIRDGKDAEKSVRSGINELIEQKYMQRYRVFDLDTGKVHHWETLVSEEPFSDDRLISVVKEKYLKDESGNIIMKKITVNKITREIPIVLEREEILLCQKVKVGQSTDTKGSSLDSPKVKVGNLQVEKEGQQILTTTKTDLLQKNISSSSSLQEFKNYFKNSICILKTTTEQKFEYIFQTIDKDFLISLINYCNSAGANSFSYFETVLLEYVKKNITTAEDLEKDIANYRNMRNKAKKNKDKHLQDSAKETPKNNKGNFNNYEQRTYDFESLERKLLGWDNIDDKE